MAYIVPTDVISPKAHWHLFDVILDRGEGRGAYALGTWDGVRRVGFRWNGSAESGEIGNPQSRGLPTWTMLDPALHPAVVALLSPEKQTLARRFLDLRPPTEWQTFISEIGHFHRSRLDAIATGKTPVATLGHAMLVLHVVPFSAVDGNPRLSSDDLFRSPERFPPIGTQRPSDYRIDHGGMLMGSHAEGLGKAQRAYVHISQTGTVESVDSNLGGAKNYLELDKITDYVVKYARQYTMALNAAGIASPVGVRAGLVGVSGTRLLQQSIMGALPEDVPQLRLQEPIIEFAEAVFETVPANLTESAQALRPLLNHLARASGLPSSPFFDADGSYALKLRQGL